MVYKLNIKSNYFGARYYSSELGVWLSVDPLADKYPSMSPYNYCAGNPLKFVDPNGMDWDRAEDKATANKMDKAAQNRIDLNNTKISEIKGNGGSRGNIRDLKAQNRELEASIKERDFMGNDSKNKYRFEQIEKDGETVIKDGVIVMQYSDEPSAFHEQYHGYREGRGSPYDIYEEVTGYKREFSMLTGNEKVKPGEFLSNGWRYITAPNFAKHVTQLFNSGDDETKKSLGGYMTIIEHWKNQRRY